MDYIAAHPFYQSSASSSSSSPNSADASPSLLSQTMASASGRVSPSLSSSSSRGTPNYATVDLPQRTPSASKGGCWTCRLRRKKCDEQRDGDSCRTCARLTIECLGWGPKRPDWMRDKQAVKDYKANIKAKLTRAGLIRGQPRNSMIGARPSSTPSPFHRLPASKTKASAKSHSVDSNSLGLDMGSFNYEFDQTNLNGLGGLGSYQLSGPPAPIDFGASMYSYSPQASSAINEPIPLEFDMSLYHAPQNTETFDFNIRPPSPVNHLPLLAGQSSMQESHVMYYLGNVRTSIFRLSGHSFTNVTYSVIVRDPRGPVTNAVSAIASLHFARMRVSQGLEAPDSRPEHSTAQSFYDEAVFQMAQNKQTRGRYDDADVLAAIYLIWYHQLGSNGADFQGLLAIALDWLDHTGLASEENPKLSLLNMSASEQMVAKLTMCIEIFSSASLSGSHRPKYISLYKRLLGESQSFWGVPDTMMDDSLHMDTLSGWPDESLLCIAEVSALAYWKWTEQRKGTLSLRELLRRGDDIEQRLRSRKPRPAAQDVPLHPNLTHVLPAKGSSVCSLPDEETMRLCGNICRETALLYLHTTVNEMQPGVPEIANSVNTVIQLLHNFGPSELDWALMFPVCLAGCMTDDPAKREMVKTRLQSHDGSIGKMLRVRLLIEAVWHKRDTRGGVADWRDIMHERCPGLLLL